MTKAFLLGAGKEIDTNQQTVKVNQIIQMEGYSYDRYVVYETFKNEYGFMYKLINLRTKDFLTTRIIRPLSEKFGIGYYYDAENPEFMDAFEVAALRYEAEQQQQAEQEAERKENERKDKLREIGRERLKALLPQNAKAVIIACKHENKSGTHEIVRIVILGFSSHTKRNFQEMRKHAGNFEETKYLTEKNSDYEHRENYSGGSDCYLGKSKYHGWIIEKEGFSNPEYFIERYSLVAGEPENICIKTDNPETIDCINLDIQIVDYSEKAIAIFGDTISIKDVLGGALHGKFNKNLTHEGVKKAGWVFPKSREEEVINVLKKYRGE